MLPHCHQEISRVTSRRLALAVCGSCNGRQGRPQPSKRKETEHEKLIPPNRNARPQFEGEPSVSDQRACACWLYYTTHQPVWQGDAGTGEISRVTRIACGGGAVPGLRSDSYRNQSAPGVVTGPGGSQGVPALSISIRCRRRVCDGATGANPTATQTNPMKQNTEAETSLQTTGASLAVAAIAATTQQDPSP